MLTIDGQRLQPLSIDDLQYFEARFFLVPGTGTVYVDSNLSVIRQRAVGEGFREDLTVMNHSAEQANHTIRVDAACDFADLFEVKDALGKKRDYLNRVDGERLILAYRRGTYDRETWITSTAPADVDASGFSFNVAIEPHGQWETTLHVATALGAGHDDKNLPTLTGGMRRTRTNLAKGLEDWIAAAPQLTCDSESLNNTYRRSIVDLAALRFETHVMPGQALC